MANKLIQVSTLDEDKVNYEKKDKRYTKQKKIGDISINNDIDIDSTFSNISKTNDL